MILSKKLLVVLLLLTTAACTTRSIHSVQHSAPLSLNAHKVLVSTEFRQVNWREQLENASFYIKNGTGHSIINFLLIQEQDGGFEADFFGGESYAKNKLKSFSEKINNISFNSNIYAYDFRFKRGVRLMELIDKSINRSCGLVKVYTSAAQSLQVSYGKVIDCGILQMSLANHKQYRISELLSELNETAKKAFNIEKI